VDSTADSVFEATIVTIKHTVNLELIKCIENYLDRLAQHASLCSSHCTAGRSFIGSVIMELRKTKAWPVAAMMDQKIHDGMITLERLDFSLPTESYAQSCPHYASPEVSAFVRDIREVCHRNREMIASTRFDDAALSTK